MNLFPILWSRGIFSWIVRGAVIVISSISDKLAEVKHQGDCSSSYQLPNWKKLIHVTFLGLEYEGNNERILFKWLYPKHGYAWLELTWAWTPIENELIISWKNKLIQEQDSKINQLDCLVENLMRQILRFRTQEKMLKDEQFKTKTMITKSLICRWKQWCF